MIGYNKSEIVGKMRERVILQNRIITQSDSGFQSEIYNDIGIYWSKIEYKTGFEEEDADKITNQQKINITLRYNILVNVNSRFVYRNELYQVEKVEYSDDRRFMTCVCVWRSSYTSIYAGSIFCSASLLAQSSLSAALMRVIKYQASLNAFGSVTADINFVQKAQASLLTSAIVSGDINIPKIFNASLLATGTTTADLTVGAGFDADAQAFFDRVTTAGGTLTTTEKNAVNTLVVQMKAAGIWTKMKAIYPMVGASAAACAQNLKSASFTGTFNGGFTYANTGVTGNGTSAYFNTNFNPITQSLDVANCHISAYTRQDETNFSGFGRFDKTTGVNRCLAVFIIENTNFYYEIGAGIASGFPATLNKGFHIVKSLSGIGKGYLNNVQKGSNFTASGTFVSDTLWLCGLPVVPFTTYYNQKETSFGSIGDGLTDVETTNFYTIVQAFQTTLNRQV